MKYLQNIRIDANLYQFIEYSFVESQKLQYRLHSYVSIIPIISLIQTLKNRGRIYFQNFRSIAIINSLPPPIPLPLTFLLRFSNATKCLNTAR